MRSTTAPARLGAPLLALALAACIAGPNAEIPGEPGLFAAVKTFYDARGLEEGGTCLSPRLGNVTSTEVLESTADRLVVRVDYIYGQGIPWWWDICRGIGSRVFTLARRPDGFDVTEMTGIQHPKGIRIERIDDSDVW